MQSAPIPRAEVKITAAKGRPMLTWVGKRPLRHVVAFPAQHVETFDPAYDAPNRTGGVWSNWPSAYPPGGLLFHGDNKEVLAHLLANGFRGKVNLVYIDPPFDSGADYVRKVTLRGPKGTAKLDAESYTLGEQIQYTDIWANDNYLQFMFERLLLLKELLANDGTLYLHCDESRAHHLRCLLDEIFGEQNFLSSICWYFSNKPQFSFVSHFPRDVQTIHVYSKNSEDHKFVHQYVENVRARRQNVVTWDKALGRRVSKRDEEGNVVYRESTERLLGSMWNIPMVNPAGSEREEFPTQKPEVLLERVILASSEPGDLVLDCFVGSGTTPAVAQRLGRKWIACDINKGAIQTTSKRLQTIIGEQIAQAGKPEQAKLGGVESDDTTSPPAQLSFAVHRVNDYDLAIQHLEAVRLACEHLGVERTKTDTYFDGTLGKRLVKIVAFNHPLTVLDLEELRREIEARPGEDRGIVVVCLGKQSAADAWTADWNQMRRGKVALNRIEIIELRTDPKYGKFFKHNPAKARVEVRRKGEAVLVEIKDFISPSIIERLDQQAALLRPKIDDWRAMVDCVLIDARYDGKVFKITVSDVPERKTDVVSGRYEIPSTDAGPVVAVKIIDMLGEEALTTQKV